MTNFAPEMDIPKRLRLLEDDNFHPDEKVMEIRDNGGRDTKNGSLDRYCVVYWTIGSYQGQNNYYDMMCMNAIPFHPQMGIGMHTTGSPGDHNGELIKFNELPEDCQKAVILDLEFDQNEEHEQYVRDYEDEDGWYQQHLRDHEKGRRIKC